MKIVFRFQLCLLLAVLPFVLYAQQRNPAGNMGIGVKVREYEHLLEQKKAENVDTSEAERMNRESRDAAKQGDQKKALQLLDQAIVLLGGSSQQSPDQGQKQRDGPASKGRKGDRRRERAETPENEKPANPRFSASSQSGKPVFVLAFTHHYNGPGGYYATASEVRRTADVFHRYQVPGTLFFDGILVERLKAEDPGLFAQINEWRLPLGYHGEETHGPYPVPSDLCAEVYELREAHGFSGTWSITTGRDWSSAVRMVEDRYAHALEYRIDDKTRRLDRRNEGKTVPGRVGGLRLVQQEFGRDVSMMPSHALESAPEGYAFRRMSRFAFDQPAAPIASHTLRIFGIQQLEQEVMRIGGEEHSIFWFMGRLASKGDDSGEVSSHADLIRRRMATLDRSQPRLLLMGFSNMEESEVAKTIHYMNEEFFSANPGSAWVSGETLPDHFEPEKEYAPSAGDLTQIAETLIREWKSRPPDMVAIQGRTFSLCDVFEAFMLALADPAEGKGVGSSVRLSALYGPVTEDGKPGLAKETPLSVNDIYQAAKLVLKGLPGGSSDRFVPAKVTVGQVSLNAAESLYAMAQAFLGIQNGVTNAVTVPPSSVYPPYGDILDTVFKPKATQPLCYTKGQLWTVKPARCKERPVASDLQEAWPVLPLTKTGSVFVVFASNLDREGGCYREDHSGACLYSVIYNRLTGKASQLKRLLNLTDRNEWFPALSPDADYIVYEAQKPMWDKVAYSSIRYVPLNNPDRDDNLIYNARFPCISKDGCSLLYSMSREHNVCVAELTRMKDGTLKVGQSREVVDKRLGADVVGDPEFFPDGKRIAFHLRNNPGGRAGGAIIGIDGAGFQKVTPEEGYGHVTISPDGNMLAFSNSGTGQISLFRLQNDKWVSTIFPLSTAPSDYQCYDDRYRTVNRVCHSYLKWIASDLFLVSSHGSDEQSHFTFCRIYLVQWEGGDAKPVVYDFSGAVEKLVDKTKKDFCSADGRRLP